MLEAIGSGLILGSILALSVGPVIFTIIKQSLNNGYTGGFSFVAGVWVSDIILVILGNAFSELLTNLLEYKKTISYLGSAFLVALGIFYVFFKKVKLRTDEEGRTKRFRKRDMARIFGSGFLINTLNPSVILFWLTTATTFAVKYDWQQRISIFAVCIGVNILADGLKVLMAGVLRKKLTLQTISKVNKVAGTILIAFGIALLYGVMFLSKKFQ